MIKDTADGNESGNEEGAEEIAEKNERPVFEELGKRDLAVEKGGEHEVVAGEKFAASDDDHGEASGENTGAGDFAAVDVTEGGAGGGESNKHAGKDAE